MAGGNSGCEIIAVDLYNPNPGCDGAIQPGSAPGALSLEHFSTFAAAGSLTEPVHLPLCAWGKCLNHSILQSHLSAPLSHPTDPAFSLWEPLPWWDWDWSSFSPIFSLSLSWAFGWKCLVFILAAITFPFLPLPFVSLFWFLFFLIIIKITCKEFIMRWIYTIFSQVLSICSHDERSETWTRGARPNTAVGHRCGECTFGSIEGLSMVQLFSVDLWIFLEHSTEMAPWITANKASVLLLMIECAVFSYSPLSSSNEKNISPCCLSHQSFQGKWW